MVGLVKTPSDILGNLASGNSALYKGPTFAGRGIIPANWLENAYNRALAPQPPGPAVTLSDPKLPGLLGLSEGTLPNMPGASIVPQDFGTGVNPNLADIEANWDFMAPDQTPLPNTFVGPGGPGYPDRASREDLIAAAQTPDPTQNDELFPSYEYGAADEGLNFDQLLEMLGGEQSAVAPTPAMQGTGSPIMDWLGFDTPDNEGRFTDLGDTLIDLGARMMAGDSPNFFQNVGNAVLGTNQMLDTKKETQFNRDLAIAEYNQREAENRQRVALGIGQLMLQEQGQRAATKGINWSQPYPNQRGGYSMMGQDASGHVIYKDVDPNYTPQAGQPPFPEVAKQEFDLYQAYLSSYDASLGVPMLSFPEFISLVYGLQETQNLQQ